MGKEKLSSLLRLALLVAALSLLPIEAVAARRVAGVNRVLRTTATLVHSETVTSIQLALYKVGLRLSDAILRLSDPIRRPPGAQSLLAKRAADNTVTHHFRHKELAVSVGLAGHQMNRE